MRMNSITPVAIGFAAFGLAGAARAEDAAVETVLATADVVVTQACDGIEAGQADPRHPDLPIDGANWRVLPNKRLAYFAASHAGEMVAPADALQTLRGFDPANVENRPTGHKFLKDLLYLLQGNLAANKYDLRAFNSDGTPVHFDDAENNLAWLSRPEIVLRCKLPERDATTVASNGAAGPAVVTSPPKKGSMIAVKLRGSVEALAAKGTARESAAAASFAFTRNKTYQDDGSRTTANSYAVNAVLGIDFDHRLTSSLFIYGGYELKQNRSKPAPVLTPPATARDSDTEIVTLGAGLSRLVPLGRGPNAYSTSLMINFNGSYKFDLVKDSERVHGELNLAPYLSNRLCTIGGLTDYGNGFWSGCEITGITRFEVITRHGSLLPTSKDHFAYLGGKLGVSFYYGDPSENAAFATAQYLNLRRIDGDPSAFDHIRQHKVALGYRWWQGKAYALEAKAELTDGINPNSFADENALTLGFGIIF